MDYHETPFFSKLSSAATSVDGSLAVDQLSDFCLKTHCPGNPDDAQIKPSAQCSFLFILSKHSFCFFYCIRCVQFILVSRLVRCELMIVDGKHVYLLFALHLLVFCF